MRIVAPVLLLLLGVVVGSVLLRGGDGALHPDDPRHATGHDRIVMLAAEWCGYCRRQQAEFDRAGVRYQRLDIDTDAGSRALRALGAKGVPVTVIGQDVVRGYDIAALGGKLAPLGYRIY